MDNLPKKPDRRLSVAPMMEWTDRHQRVFMRGLTKQTLLYTEMVVAPAIIFSKDGPGRFLDYNQDIEHPIALQLGGSDPKQLSECCKIASNWNYDEINLNCGCPSDRVSAGRFGACLMAEPDVVADCIKAMQDATDIPITVKHRIGIDDLDSYELLAGFVDRVAQTGCETFIIHARKAWLKGLSPKQNREVPPLRHDIVHMIKKDFPHLEIILNGGIQTVEEAASHLDKVDGVMIGRATYETPYIMANADQLIFGNENKEVITRQEALERFLPYVEEQVANDVYVRHMAKHLFGLFQSQRGAKAWRRYLSEHMFQPGVGAEVISEAAKLIE
ncbi:tRNA-dihydrouridine synthase A [Candidatus Terasakiella magnetica]|uniref:tRNA-dihydrouridine(20/20a) synthase n=1 Tax=Candidatus Terasakiella magnetica TaxID=1867952 RepID=A0A1C3RI22_9PROT|nr:tRNA dihydrouridine(20/20a) synthase DusA [Candidatus Terasakiella magnetica]SCA56918.1 tRNA-dihydrouridine synthase A [Candidatus Terasakiella magnetica]